MHDTAKLRWVGGMLFLLPQLAGFTDGFLGSIRFMVHNGKDYVPVTITQDMVGHKLGEFAHTKKRFTYK